ncbi:hypothetical protein I302_107804 [Kwoniella bestiolae CBS 10118]|uniref:Extracellular membrane protein CFEM domain-containing protein n=1 Tax=Kwoniella bestiolae CBS 10118 TaxID=1296100 RepID=A0A1B9FXI3_9TREE|nr:hypothetical protein I302_06456 [Kwoniella bestiolae CBS 10118]OCF23474.1 hypothetical protein I302_06456 [Kwoniella bestiolae CBS 10118]
MSAKTLFFVAAAAVGVAVVNAQAAPNWQYIPTACQDSCSSTIESAYLCQTTYSTSTEVYGCFCNNYPTDVDGCASCLNSNDASALGALLTSTQTACPEAEKQCFFECSFDTCASSDIACQCDSTYLSNIYNCASCNTANGNTGATQVTDFQALQESCKNQNYTGADQEFTTKGLPTVATAGYAAPTLTATGGGAAATGEASDLAGGDATVASDAAGTTAAASAAATSASKASSAASKAATAAASGSASKASSTASRTSASASAASASSSGASSGALNVAAPAFGGLVGLVGAVVALF